MATSLTQVLLTAQDPPACVVTIRCWRPRRTPETFDVIVPPGIIVRGCTVRGEGAERRVRAPGHEFATREAAERFRICVLAALDAEGGKGERRD
jgi:hypothetical protein